MPISGLSCRKAWFGTRWNISPIFWQMGLFSSFVVSSFLAIKLFSQSVQVVIGQEPWLKLVIEWVYFESQICRMRAVEWSFGSTLVLTKPLASIISCIAPNNIVETGECECFCMLACTCDNFTEPSLASYIYLWESSGTQGGSTWACGRHGIKSLNRWQINSAALGKILVPLYIYYTSIIRTIYHTSSSMWLAGNSSIQHYAI